MQVLFFKGTVAFPVDPFALRVQHIIVFKQMLADIKVVAFDAFLGLFHDPAEQTALNRQARIDLHPRHQSFHLSTAKQAHQFIFKRQVKAGGARITLAGGAAAQLVVNAACFMAF